MEAYVGALMRKHKTLKRCDSNGDYVRVVDILFIFSQEKQAYIWKTEVL